MYMQPPCKKADVCPDPKEWRTGGSNAYLGIDMPVGTKCGAERWCQLVTDAGMFVCVCIYILVHDIVHVHKAASERVCL